MNCNIKYIIKTIGVAKNVKVPSPPQNNNNTKYSKSAINADATMAIIIFQFINLTSN